MNRERLVELMRQHDVSVVVGATPPNVCYLTGHVGWAQHVYQSLPCIATFTDDGSEGTDLVVPRSETPYHRRARAPRSGLRATAAEPACSRPNRTWCSPRRRTGSRRSSRAVPRTHARRRLAATGVGRGVRSGRIVVDDTNVVPDLIARMSEALPDAEVVAGGGLFLMARLVKTPSEILALRRAAEVNDGALQHAMAAIGAGVTEAAIAAIWRREIAGVGAKPLWFHLGTGRRSAYVFPPGERAFEPGDLFMLDAGLVYEGVLSDMGHCGTIGEPTEQARDEFGACKTAFEEAESAVAAGVMTSEIFHRLSNGLAGSVLDAVKLRSPDTRSATRRGSSRSSSGRPHPSINPSCRRRRTSRCRPDRRSTSRSRSVASVGAATRSRRRSSSRRADTTRSSTNGQRCSCDDVTPQMDEQRGAALSRLRVVELANFLAGPFAGMCLGDFGADVVKVERPRTGDECRLWGNNRDGVGLYFKVLNRNKRSVTADLHTALGQEIVRRLAREPTCSSRTSDPEPSNAGASGTTRCRRSTLG